MIKSIIVLVFVITFPSVNMCADRFDNVAQLPSRFDNFPSRFDNPPNTPAGASASDDEQKKPLFICATNVFAYSDSDKKYKSCTENRFLSKGMECIMPLAAEAHLINNGGQWNIRATSKDSSGKYSYSIPINNAPQGFLENQKNQKNNFPLYAIDNQGFLYKCELPPLSTERKIPSLSTGENNNTIQSESFLATCYRKYPNLTNLTLGVTGVAAAAFIVFVWKCADRMYHTNLMDLILNRLFGTNYNTKI